MREYAYDGPRAAYEAGYAAGRLAAQSGPPREPTREVGWLIEAVAGGLYWCGGSCGWTPSPNLACRFARAADANAAREWLRLPPVDIRVAEHIWIDVAPQTGGKAAPITKPSQPDHAGTAALMVAAVAMAIGRWLS